MFFLYKWDVFMKNESFIHHLRVHNFFLLFICFSAIFLFSNKIFVTNTLESSNSILNPSYGFIINSNGSIITSNTTLNSMNISLGGNLDIDFGANLVINNSLIILNNSVQYLPPVPQYVITAHSGSSLSIINSEITIIGSLDVLYYIQALSNSLLNFKNDSFQHGGGGNYQTGEPYSNVIVFTDNSTITDCIFSQITEHTQAVEYDSVVNGTFYNNSIETYASNGISFSHSTDLHVNNNTFTSTISSDYLLSIDGSSNLIFANNSFYTNSGTIFNFDTGSQISLWKNNYRYLPASTSGAYNKGPITLLENGTLGGIDSPFDTYFAMGPTSIITLNNDTFYELFIFGLPSTNLPLTSDIENVTINYLHFYSANNIFINNSTILNFIESAGNSNVTLTQNTILGQLHSFANGEIHAYLNFFGSSSSISQYNLKNYVYLDNGIYGNYYAQYSPSLTDLDGDGISETAVLVNPGSFYSSIYAKDALLNDNISLYIGKIDIFKPYLNIIALNQNINFNTTNKYEMNFKVTATDKSGVGFISANINFSNGTVFSFLNYTAITSGLLYIFNVSLGRVPINTTFTITVQTKDSFGNVATEQKMISITTYYTTVVYPPEPSSNSSTNSISTTKLSTNQLTSTSKGSSAIDSTNKKPITSPFDEMMFVLSMISLSLLLNLNKKRKK